MKNLEISESDVWITIHSIDDSKSVGPEGIHCRVIKELVQEIATPLFIIFNSSLNIPKDR